MIQVLIVYFCIAIVVAWRASYRYVRVSDIVAFALFWFPILLLEIIVFMVKYLRDTYREIKAYWNE